MPAMDLLGPEMEGEVTKPHTFLCKDNNMRFLKDFCDFFETIDDVSMTAFFENNFLTYLPVAPKDP